MKMMKGPVAAAALCLPYAADAPPPAAVVGRWVATTSSATNCWRTDGRLVGNGSGTARSYEFDADGTYRYDLVMSVRTGTFVSMVDNSCQGTVTFTADSFSTGPTKGHYHTSMGGHVTDRNMTADDSGRLTKTYPSRKEAGADGKPRFVVPFPDGSKAEFRPADPPPAAKP